MAETTIKYVSLGNLQTYDTKIKEHISSADATLKTNLEGQVEVVANALDSEITRAKAAEAANANAAQAAQTDVNNLAGKVGVVPEGSTVMDIITNIQESAYDDTEIRNLISGLDTNKADKTQVATDIAAAVKVEEDARKEAVAGVQGEVDALETVVANNKTAIEGTVATLEEKVDANESDIEGKMTDLTARVVANETAVSTTLPNAIDAEKERAEGVESGLDGRLVKVEAFFETAEDETLDTALDTLVELQKYLEGEGAVADQMLLDIAANKKAIEDHVATDHDFAAADATLKSELEGQIALKADKTTVEAMDTAYKAADEALDARLDVLEAINHDAYIAADTALKNELNGAITLKADQTALDEAVEALEGADEALDGRIAVLEGKFGETGSVATDISTAKQEAIDAAATDAATKANQALVDAKAYADEEDAKIEERVDALESASASHALASDLNTLAGRVTVNEGDIAQLKTDVDAVEALAATNKAAHEANAAAIALKASQADLEAESTRATTREAELQAEIDAFVECTTEEINALFA